MQYTSGPSGFIPMITTTGGVIYSQTHCCVHTNKRPAMCLFVSRSCHHMMILPSVVTVQVVLRFARTGRSNCNVTRSQCQLKNEHVCTYFQISISLNFFLYMTTPAFRYWLELYDGIDPVGCCLCGTVSPSDHHYVSLCDAQRKFLLHMRVFSINIMVIIQ